MFYGGIEVGHVVGMAASGKRKEAQSTRKSTPVPSSISNHEKKDKEPAVPF